VPAAAPLSKASSRKIPEHNGPCRSDGAQFSQFGAAHTTKLTGQHWRHIGREDRGYQPDFTQLVAPVIARRAT
jgi:hypothetical protein